MLRSTIFMFSISATALASPAWAAFVPVGPGTSGEAGVYQVDRDAGIGTANFRGRNNHGFQAGSGATRLGKQPNDIGGLFHFDTAPVRSAIAAELLPFGITPQQAVALGALRVNFAPFIVDSNDPDPGPFIAIESFLSGNDWVEGNGTGLISPPQPNFTGQAVTFRFAVDERTDLNPNLTPVPWSDPDGTEVFNIDELANRFRNTAGFTVHPLDAFAPVLLDTAVWYPLLYGSDGNGTAGGHLRTYGDAPEPNDNVTSFKQREANASQRAYLFVEFDAALIPEPSAGLMGLMGAGILLIRKRRSAHNKAS